MVKRKPLEISVFDDIEAVKRYDRESRARMRSLARSFVTVARKWGMTSGKVLDVGTGTGLLAIEFAKRVPGVKVVGLDLSDVALELARDNAQESKMSLRVSFKVGDAEDMPFEDGTFDLVISSNTLHLIRDPIGMFDEIQRVLKPKGRFLISDLRRSWLGILTDHIRAAYSPKEVRDLLGRSKLQNWKVEDSFLWLSILSEE